MTVAATAVAPTLVRESKISGLALVTLFCLNGLVLSALLIMRGFDLGAALTMG